jgi:predicted nucleic acid-binding protein
MSGAPRLPRKSRTTEASVLSDSATEVLLDASPLCRFASQSLLGPLREYPGDRARIAREVERELLRLAKRPEFSQLQDYLSAEGQMARTLGKWPKRTGQLPEALRAEFVKLINLQQKIDEHERAHAGEVATVLMAQHRGSSLIVIDDQWGSALAKSRGLQVMSTARLVLEMIVKDALEQDVGFTVYDAATSDHVGWARFQQSLDRLRRGS